MLTLLILLPLLTHTPTTLADDTLQELQDTGQLQLDTELRPAGPLVPGQKAALVLRISTNRWFAGGTRIGIPEVPGLVVLQTEQFASNASENRGGQSWVVQSWTLDVYAQRAGDFTIPPISLRVTVNTESMGNVEGNLNSDPIQFSAVIPQGLEGAPHWVAAPSFSVRQQFSRQLDDLKVGDAFDQEILFEATDVMAMMLPAVETKRQPGLAAYPSPPELSNDSNRGQLTARRRERITYVVEAEGLYRLPGREFFWWDTGSGQVQLLTLPETGIAVGTASASEARPVGAALQRWLLPAGAGLLLLLLLWLARKWLAPLQLHRLAAILQRARRQWRALRRPALPQKLNPDSSAAD